MEVVDGVSETTYWTDRLGEPGSSPVDGLIPVKGYLPEGRPASEVATLEKALEYGADAVFFEAGGVGKQGSAQAFVYISQGPANDLGFAALHKRLWSWGGVPLLYRRTDGLVQLFRCGHHPDFISKEGQLVCRPVKSLLIAAAISSHDAWWNAAQLRNGTLWDDPEACKLLLSAQRSAHRRLVNAVARINLSLKSSGLLSDFLRRKLLILSLLIAYLSERGILEPEFFSKFKDGATAFPDVLDNGTALVQLLTCLEERFNGNVFTISDEDRSSLITSDELRQFSDLVEAKNDSTGQLNIWKLYSFRDLPVEVISHIYEIFVEDADSSVYTPPALVRLMLDEALSLERLDEVTAKNRLIFDPSCGSGVFLVEAYKRLVLHWRSRNSWARPGVDVLKGLLNRLRGVDVEAGAVELAAFSLCLALCDALETEEIRASVRLFPQLNGTILFKSCFFEAKRRDLIVGEIGIVTGNPPFTSSLKTEGSKTSAGNYLKEFGSFPDKQVAYLFLHEAMRMLAPGGVLCMLQQYNLLYNLNSAIVRQRFFEQWDVREVLDFVSIRGLFTADTKVVAIVAEARPAPDLRRILHAVFRRDGRADAEQSFTVDFYDLHWMKRSSLLQDNGPTRWRSNLLGGARAYSFAQRLLNERTLHDHATNSGWIFGEGFAEGQRKISKPADHLIGKPLLPSDALTTLGIDEQRITTVANQPIEVPRSAALFTAPILLIREQEDLPHAIWSKSYLTYKNKLFGLAAKNVSELQPVDDWLSKEAVALRAFVAITSLRMFTQKATTLSSADIMSLPYPEHQNLDLSESEEIVANDIVTYYRDYIRLGSSSALAETQGVDAVEDFASTYCTQVNSIYHENQLSKLPCQKWPGIICQPFVFGTGGIDWTNGEQLKGKLDTLLREQRSSVVSMTRIARVYDGNFIFLIKPDRLRYWLRSIALRDSDDTVADLRMQGF